MHASDTTNHKTTMHPCACACMPMSANACRCEPFVHTHAIPCEPMPIPVRISPGVFGGVRVAV
eukprot:6760755-Alexandrium_andersonii.AAC.1